MINNMGNYQKENASKRHTGLGVRHLCVDSSQMKQHAIVKMKPGWLLSKTSDDHMIHKTNINVYEEDPLRTIQASTSTTHLSLKRLGKPYSVPHS